MATIEVNTAQTNETITAHCSGEISPDATTEPTHKSPRIESGWKQNI